MGNYVAYPAYKDSGVEWLGDVPEHWEVAILKRKFNVQLGKMLQTKPNDNSDTENEYLCALNIHWNELDLTTVKTMWFSAEDKSKYDVKKGDLLVSEGGDVGRSAIYNLERTLYIQNAINRIRPIGNDLTIFLYYWIYSLKAKGYIDIICNKSTISHLTAEKLSSIEAIFPPIKEQQQIANFLDDKTTHLDKLIGQKQQMIVLLNEKRMALITQAVTKGLDLTVPMKDSGVEWLGDVPEHWEVERLKFITDRVQTGTTPPTSSTNDYFFDATINWFTPVDFSNSALKLLNAKRKINQYAIDDKVVKLIPAKSILIIGIGATLGKVGYIEKEAACNQQINIIYPSVFVNEKYISSSLSVMQEVMRIISNSSTLGIMNQETTKQIVLAIPQIEEQNQIANYLDTETQKIDDMITTVKQAIATLQEYRTALITAAVTGKIDVRGYKTTRDDWAAPAITEPQKP